MKKVFSVISLITLIILSTTLYRFFTKKLNSKRCESVLVSASIGAYMAEAFRRIPYMIKGEYDIIIKSICTCLVMPILFILFYKFRKRMLESFLISIIIAILIYVISTYPFLN